jgi:hypothetical protein
MLWRQFRESFRPATTVSIGIFEEGLSKFDLSWEGYKMGYLNERSTEKYQRPDTGLAE